MSKCLHHHQSPKRASRQAPMRRGVALLLVIVSLGIASTLTTFYLASQDNSGVIGVNAASALESRAAARSGVELGLAVLQTGANWLTAAQSGPILKTVPFGAAVVNISVTNLMGDPPTAQDTDVLLTAVASAGRDTAIAQMIVTLQPVTDPLAAIDPMLGEFGIFTIGPMTADIGTTLNVWPLSPASTGGKTIKLGGGFTTAADLNLGLATLSNTQLYVRSGASLALQSMVNSPQFVGGGVLPLVLPAIPARLPASLAGMAGLPAVNAKYSGLGINAAVAPGAYANFLVDKKAVATLAPGDYSVQNLDVKSGGVLRVQGAVNIWAQGSLTVDGKAAVELADSASSVSFFVAQDVTVNDAVVGLDRTIAQITGRTPADVSVYQNPSNVRFFALTPLDGGASSPFYDLMKNALVVATVHAPTADVLLSANAALMGRVSSNTIDLQSGASLLYDPSLGNNVGFTSASGPLYNPDGTLITGLATAMASFNTSNGLDALIAFLSTALPGASGGATPSVSSRIASRAIGRLWPMKAIGLESPVALDPLAMKLQGSFIDYGVNNSYDTAVSTMITDVGTLAVDRLAVGAMLPVAGALGSTQTIGTSTVSTSSNGNTVTTIQ